MQNKKMISALFSWIKLGGHPLPKKPLRPFLYPPFHSLDDRQLVFAHHSGPIAWLETGMQFAFLIAFIAALTTIVEDNKPMWILSTIIFTGLGFWLRHMLKHTEPSHFNIFDRERGTFSFHIPNPFGIIEVLEAPWSEFEGRLLRGATRHGESRHNLYVFHTPTERGYLVDDSIMGIEPLLSEWSFLAQYMDKEAPLPDIGPLKEYPNRSAGVGTQWEWENNIRHNQPDPYYAWLDEIKKNPELDVLKHTFDRRRNRHSS